MERALENSESNPAYLDYFGMNQPPFAPLSDPSSPIFLSEQYSLLMAHLSSATEQSDCLLVICGADGSGKTTLLNRYAMTLSNDVTYATFDDTCIDGTQFYTAFLKQLGFPDISGSLKELRRITQEFLIHMGKAGDPVLLIVDNAHLVSPTVYEQLRWIAETKVDERRVLSIVLAGNYDLPRIMASPAMRTLHFRNNIEFNIRVYTEDETEDYVRHRLRLAGGMDAAKFSNDSRPLIYSLTGGVPKLINVLCNEVLAEAYGNKTRVISTDLVRMVADNLHIEPTVVPHKSKGRRKTDTEFKIVLPDEKAEARIVSREAPATTGSGSEGADTAVAELLTKVAHLSEQIGEIKAEKKQAERNIEARDDRISQLQKQLEEHTQKAEEQAAITRNNDVDIQKLKKALSETTKALRKSETEANKPTPTSDTPAEEVEKLLQHVDQQSEQLGILEAAAKQAELDIEARDSEIVRLQKQLDAQTKESEKQNGIVRKHAGEIEELKQKLSDTTKALRESEKDAKKLATDLNKEERATKRADAEATKAKARIEKIEEMKSNLQSTVSSLTEELKEANKRATKTHALEQNTKSLKEKIETKSGELTARDESLANAEEALRVATEECEALRNKMSDLETELASQGKECETLRASITELEAELDSQSKEPTAIQEGLSDEDDMPTITKANKDKKKGKRKEAKSANDAIKSLEIIRDGQVDRVLDISFDQPRIMIGRSDDNELCLVSRFVSRHHALISCSKEGVFIEDLNSFNGVVINSEKITRRELHAGDTVLVGDFILRPRST